MECLVTETVSKYVKVKQKTRVMSGSLVTSQSNVRPRDHVRVPQCARFKSFVSEACGAS